MTIEKAIAAGVEPIVDKLLEIQRRVDAIKIKDGIDGKDGKDGQDGKSVELDQVVDVIKSDPIFIEQLKAKDGIDGKNGKDGQDGIGIKSLYQEGNKLAFELDNGQEFIAELIPGAKGDTGSDGKDGKDGKDGQDGDVGLGLLQKIWEPEQVHREGSFVQHNIGQIFRAKKDTASTPGTADWERIGTWGFNWTGIKKADHVYQDGDLYIDNGTTFLYVNGKGRMFAKRGSDGKDGKDGLDGRNGKDAAELIAVQWNGKSFALAFSDGAIHETEIDLDWIDQRIIDVAKNLLDNPEYEDLSTGIAAKRFRGLWLPDEKYQIGDMVKWSGGLWICHNTPPRGEMTPDYFTMMVSGGGGAGGIPLGSGGWVGIAGSNLNMMNFKISNLPVPVSPGDAATKAYVDSRTSRTVLVQESATVTGAAGADTQAKLTTLYGSTPDRLGLIFVGQSQTRGGDNKLAGVWQWTGAQWVQTPIGSSGGAGLSFFAFDPNSITSTTATDLQSALAETPSLVTGTRALGDVVVTRGGVGAKAKFNGSAIWDGSSWRQISVSLGAAIFGALKSRPSDADATTTGWPVSSIQMTTQNGSRELKALDTTGNWVTIYSEVEALRAIAAGSLFRGTVDAAGLAAIPASAPGNRGHYYTWSGGANYQVTAGTPGIGGSLAGATLNVGDWIQSVGDGNWAHIAGDILTRARWLTLGSLGLYQMGSGYEADSIVRWIPVAGGGIHYFKATRPVTPADPQPGAKATPVTIAVTGLPAVAGGVVTVTVTGGPATATDFFDVDLQSDAVAGTDPQTINITAGQTADQIADQIITDWSSPDVAATKGGPGVVLLTPTDPATTIIAVPFDPNDIALISAFDNPWLDISPSPKLSDLLDVDNTTTPIDGNALVWDAATSKWKPKALSSPIVYLGEGDFNIANIADPTNLFGMPAGTQPSPTQWPPLPGDQFLSLTSGKVTVFTGPGGVTVRAAGAITGGNQVGSIALDDLTDVDLTTTAPVAGDQIIFDGTNWVPRDTYKFKGALANQPPTAKTGDVYYQTAPLTIPGQPAAVAVAWDARMLPVLQGGAVPSAPDPSQPARDPTTAPLALTATNFYTSFQGVTYNVINTVRLAARITAGETTPAQFAAGSNPGMAVAVIPVSPTVILNPGMYRFDGAQWLATGGGSISTLTDVQLTSPTAGNLLTYDGTNWVNSGAPSYTKAEIDSKIGNLAAGIVHSEAVTNILSAPPATPAPDSLYIIGANPTGVWAGKTGQLAQWVNGAWVYTNAVQGEAHLNENDGSTYSWNSATSTWNKVGNTGLKFQSLTKAAYDAIVVKDPSTMYLISG